MAGNTTKFKINNLAKDLEMKSKDLLAEAEKLGVKVKNPGALLDSEEFDVIFNALTNANQINNINSYLSGETVIVLEGEAAAESVPASEAKQEQKQAKPVENTVAAQEKKPEKTEKSKKVTKDCDWLNI